MRALARTWQVVKWRVGRKGAQRHQAATRRSAPAQLPLQPTGIQEDHDWDPPTRQGCPTHPGRLQQRRRCSCCATYSAPQNPTWIKADPSSEELQLPAWVAEGLSTVSSDPGSLLGEASLMPGAATRVAQARHQGAAHRWRERQHARKFFGCSKELRAKVGEGFAQASRSPLACPSHVGEFRAATHHPRNPLRGG